jgi:hypothetical protein
MITVRSGANPTSHNRTESFLAMTTGIESAYFDRSTAARGMALRDAYQTRQPFPHVVIDDFLPAPVLDRILAEWPAASKKEFDRNQERLKSEYDPDGLSTPFARSLFYAFNSAPFIAFLEGLTGITGLIPDPYFLGGGFHETKAGGHLSIHADFNLYRPLRLRRRINVLVYLNKEWDPAYGGSLELWSRDMKSCQASIAPLFNRCVIFNTEDDSYHGHPDPLVTPAGKTRRSLALYYYTASDAIFDEHRAHTTSFKVRPGSRDRRDYRIFLRELLGDLTPPAAKRMLRRLARRP